MKAIFFVISLFILFILFSVFSLLLPSKVVISNQVMVRAPVDKVKEEVAHFRNWKNWNGSFGDPEVDVVYLTDDSSKVQLDDSKKSLVFDMHPPQKDTILVDVTGAGSTAMQYAFVFIERETIHSNLMLQVQIHLKWYPWEKVKGLFMQKMSDSYFESLVERIKISAEKE